jgi:hypothetical protein
MSSYPPPPSISDAHEGRRWKQSYGVPFDLFVELSNIREAWMEANGGHTYLKNQLPFKLRAMACLRQLRIGCPLHKHREGYGLQTAIFREFFYYFLDWLWAIKGDYIKMPTTKEEIEHVESLFRLVGHPSFLGSIDCVHIPWRKCTWKLQETCKNKKKSSPTVMFEVLASHAIKVLHVTDMFWGCCSDFLIVKFDQAVYEIMDDDTLSYASK